MDRRLSTARLVPTLALAGLLIGACTGEQVRQYDLPAATIPTTAAPQVAPGEAPPSATAPTSTVPVTTPRRATTPPTTAAVRQPVYQDGLPQVTATPNRSTSGGTVRFSGTGFTDPMWRSNDTLWLVGMSEGGCSLYAQSDGARVTKRADGLIEGEFVVPSSGDCRQSQPLQGADVAPGEYRIAYGCTPCFIGKMTVFEAALTPQSRLRADGVGPIRIGMTLDEARQASGTPLDTVAVAGCVELVPSDSSIGVALWSHDGRTLDMISGRARSALATRAGIRSGSTVEAVEQAYPQLVRNVDEGTYLVVPAGGGLALTFEILGGEVSHLLAGEQHRIEFGGHCP